MPTTLTYTRQKPIQGEKGDTVFDALETNVDLDDAHSHDGVTSPRLEAANFTVNTAEVDGTAWGALVGTKYRQSITIPAVYSGAGIVRKVGDISLQFYELVGAAANPVAQIYPTIEYITDTTFYIYSPVNTKYIRIVYS